MDPNTMSTTHKLVPVEPTMADHIRRIAHAHEAHEEYGNDESAEELALAINNAKEALSASPEAPKSTEDEEEFERYWIYLKEPGKCPERKGPFDLEWAKRFVREVMDVRPTAYITVITPSHDSGGWPEDGGTWLSMIDRRSRPKYQRYWKNTKAAHGDHSIQPPTPDGWQDFAKLSAKANWLIGLLDTRQLFSANPGMANDKTIARLDVDIAAAMGEVSDLATVEGDDEGNLPDNSPSSGDGQKLREMLADLLEASPSLPDSFKFTGTEGRALEDMFDAELRHKTGVKPGDHLRSWLPMFRPFAYATRDDSWGELEKLISITMRNYVQLLARLQAARAALGDPL